MKKEKYCVVIRKLTMDEATSLVVKYPGKGEIKKDK